MKFVLFVENKYQELTYQQQVGGFNPTTDAEVHSLQLVLTVYRKVLKWLLVPKVLVTYFLVSIGVFSEPVAILSNKAKEQKEDELKKKGPKLVSSTNVIEKTP